MIKTRRLLRYYQRNGVKATVSEATHRLMDVINTTLSGNRGYYSCHYHILSVKDGSRNPFDIVYASPEDITQVTGVIKERDKGHLDYTPYFKPIHLRWKSDEIGKEVHYGSRMDGDWDTHNDDFSELILYRAIVNRYVDQVEWRDTQLFSHFVQRKLDNGYSQFEAEEITIKYCSHIDDIFSAIQNKGYQSQRQLGGFPLHEVTVNISRNDKLLYNCEGRHRLSIAKILEVDRIPIIILAVHRDASPIDSIDSIERR